MTSRSSSPKRRLYTRLRASSVIAFASSCSAGVATGWGGATCIRLRYEAGGHRRRRGYDETREHGADEQTARITHEDRRRMEVVAQKAERRAAQRPGERRVQPGALLGKAHAEEERRDRADAARDPVQAVEQIEGVRDGHEPEQRDEDVHDVPRRKRQQRAETQERDTREQLAEELRLGAQPHDVVYQPDEEHDRRAQHDAERGHQARAGHPADPLGTHEEGGDPEAKHRGAGNGDAAEQRGGTLVPAIECRVRNDTELERERAQQRRDRQRGKERRPQNRRDPDHRGQTGIDLLTGPRVRQYSGHFLDRLGLMTGAGAGPPVPPGGAGSPSDWALRS